MANKAETQKNTEYIRLQCENFLDKVIDGVIAVDINGDIIFVNYAAERMLGWKSKEIIGKPLVNICTIFDEKGNKISKDKRPASIALSKKIPVQSSSCFYIRKDKTIFPVDLTVAPVIEKKKFIGAINTFRDITKEKEVEKLRLDFLMLASHQLRTPLSGIKWMIETMRRGAVGDLSQKQREYLDKVYIINERMIKIVSEMFKVLNWESGIIAVVKTKISVEKICHDTFLLMRQVAKDAGILLQCNTKNKEIIETDPQIVSTILNYLVENAIDYSHSSNKVSIDAKSKGKDMIFSVKDNGIGIPKQEQGRIFERFYRASNAKYFKPNGTGLGLNIARTIAQNMGGEISFKSEEKKGSTFYLRIPKKSKPNGGIKIKSITK